MGSKGCDDITVGYFYYVGMHMALCHGPVDFISHVFVNEECAWGGFSTGGSIDIKAGDLFGGEDREGGVEGVVDFDMGFPDQQPNTYLAGLLGAIPAFRGVTSAILNQVNIGLNPYMKKWAFRLQRIEYTNNGQDQWYKQAAAIQIRQCENTCGSGNMTQPKQDIVIAIEVHQNNWDFLRGQLTVLLEMLRSHIVSDALIPWNLALQIAYRGNNCSQKYTYDICTTANIDYQLNSILNTSYAACSGSFYRWDSACLGAKAFLEDPDNQNAEAKYFIFVSSMGYKVWDSVKALYYDPLKAGNLEEGTLADSIIGRDEGYAYVVQMTNMTSNYFYSTYWSTNFNDMFFEGGMPNSAFQSTWALMIFAIEDYMNGVIDSGGGAGFEEPSEYPSFDWPEGVPSPELPPVEEGTGGSVSVFYNDMNPAHIIRECLVDLDWGMGYPETDMDDTSFTASADTLYIEKMGISMLWDRQIPLEDFVLEILKHINAVLYVSRITGKFVLKLIRDDYDVNVIPALGEDHIISISGAKRTSFGELVNSVTVQYWDSCTGNDASITIADQALVSMQGNVINTTVQYPGFTYAQLASQVCLRDLRTLSTPLLGCTVHANRHASEINIGDVFKLTWPDLNIYNVVMRVSGMAFGDGRDNHIQIQCTEDVFGYPLVAVAEPDPDDPIWEDPIKPPVPVEHQIGIEAPYYEIVQRLGESETNDQINTEPLLGYVGIAAVQPGGAINAKLWTDAGGGYTKKDSLSFCATLTLLNDVSILQNIWEYDEETDIGHATVGQHAQIDDELVRIDVIDTAAKTITVGRAVLDTLPRLHVAGARVYFWDADHGIDRTQYVTGESVDEKVLTVTGRGTLDISEAVAETVLLNNRAVRPYPPANMRIDGEYFPDVNVKDSIDVTWSHRDRLQQVDSILYDYLDSDIGPESGTTYTIRIHDSGDVEQIVLTGIVGNSQTVDISSLLVGHYRLSLFSMRDGYPSMQANEWEFDAGFPPIFDGVIPDFNEEFSL